MSYNKSKIKEPVQCKTCNVTVQKRSLFQHLKIHEEARFNCEICGVFKGKRKAALQIHKKHVHNVGEESIKDCLFCKKKLKSFMDLEQHLRTHTKERPYFCKLCPYECSIAQNLESHAKRFHSLRIVPAVHCHICSKRFLDQDCLRNHLKIHLVSVEDFPFKCAVCSKGFRDRTQLSSHERVHSKEKPFACEICNVAFSHQKSLKIHLRIHTGEKPYVCKICQMGFSRQDILNIHLRRHTGEKPYPCTVCKMKFPQLSNLKSHMRTHSGEKPYACGVCKRGFSQFSNLKCHMRTHSGEKPHSCKECKVAFADKRSLQAHFKRSHHCLRKLSRN